MTEQSETQSHMAVAQFLLHIDKEWCSEDMTQVRCELWDVYRKAKNPKNKKGGNREYILKGEAIKKVEQYIMELDRKSKEDPNPEDMKHLFQHLNFIELLGTIYIFKNRKLIDEQEEQFFRTIFGGKLHIYLKFYKSYLEKYPDSNAYKMLRYLDCLERKQTLQDC